MQQVTKTEEDFIYLGATVHRAGQSLEDICAGYQSQKEHMPLSLLSGGVRHTASTPS